MLKRILNRIELLVIGLVILGIAGFYEETNSVSRFSTNFDSIRIVIDLIIVSTLLLRAFLLIKTYRKDYVESGRPKIFEKAIYIICLISLLPDLSTWIRWNYFANLYLNLLILFSIPIALWTIEIIERISTKRNRIQNYGIALMIFAIPVIGYIFYLSNMS